MFLEGFHQGGSCPSRSRCPSRCSWTLIGCCSVACCPKLNLLFLELVLSWREVKGLNNAQQPSKKVFWGGLTSLFLFMNKTRMQIKCWSSSPTRAQESEREAHKFKAKEASVLRSTPFAPILPQQRLTVSKSISRSQSLLPKRNCHNQTSISSPCFPFQGRGSSCAGSRPEHR